MIVSYYKKPTGQMDEVMTVSKRVRTRDLQSASVILDFKNLRVEKASLDGTVVDRDWNRIMNYYYQFYKSTIDRLLMENGYEIKQINPTETQDEKSDNTD